MAPLEFDSLGTFQAAVHAVLSDAVAQRARRLLWAAPRFEGWPLEDQVLLDALTAFVRLPERRLVLLGERFDGLARSSPRFVAWRQTWGHAVDALRPVDDGVALPTVLLVDRRLALCVIDPLRWRGRLLLDAPDARLLADELDAFLQHSEPTFAASTLGL